jgi:hypothetical protein
MGGYLTPDLKQMTTPQLIDRYVSSYLQQYAFRHHVGADGRPDIRPWNRLADQGEAVHRELKSRGDEGVDAILSLIHHPNPNVRYAAVVDCLRQRTATVLPVLEEMARTNDYFETKTNPDRALQMWREGKWVVD